MDEKKFYKKPISELINFSFINLDKPSGPTSFSVSHLVKRKIGVKKTAHFGTLDPMVTGVLPVALGRACRLNEYFSHKKKIYVGIMRVHEEISLKGLKEVVGKFIGKIIQTPPVRSRVKRAPREREVFSFEILEIEDRNVLFKTEVEAGTYIRKLIHDIGLQIGGAHMLELRRTKAANFSENEKEFVNLYDFERVVDEFKSGDEESLRRILIPAEIKILDALEILEVKEGSVGNLLNGKPVFKEDIIGEIPESLGEIFAVFCGERFIEIARKVDDSESIIGKPEFVNN